MCHNLRDAPHADAESYLGANRPKVASHRGVLAQLGKVPCVMRTGHRRITATAQQPGPGNVLEALTWRHDRPPLATRRRRADTDRPTTRLTSSLSLTYDPVPQHRHDQPWRPRWSEPEQQRPRPCWRVQPEVHRQINGKVGATCGVQEVATTAATALARRGRSQRGVNTTSPRD